MGTRTCRHGSLPQVEQPQLVGKDEKDAEGCEVADDKSVNRIERTLDGTVIGEFGTEHLFVDHPS